MTKNIEEKIKYWLELAEDNLGTAKILLKNKKRLDMAFYCHQTIEKLFKGYCWFSKKGEPPYTHNLFVLAEESGLKKCLEENHIKALMILNSLNIQARYPEDKVKLLKSLSEAKCKEILNKTEEIDKWIKQLLQK